MKKNKFDIIIFLGRPAAGKSEVIDFFKNISLAERKKIFHIHDIVEIDDFRFLWDRGENDNRREKKKKKRVDTRRIKTGSYVVRSREIYKKLIEDINRFYLKNYNDPGFIDKHTIFIEFSRCGAEGYSDSLQMLHKDILEHAVIYYINVSFKEAVRKNKRRYDPDKPESILYHTVPFEVMRKYKTDDWKDLSSQQKERIQAGLIKVPFAVFNNEPEKTDNRYKIKKELLKSIHRLYDLYVE
ncbi:MAG: hypothetical protein KKH98_09275 [Spirochaetes bacterium]|nr:hypothetical protein [Spirochaetota bacterium]